MELGRPASDAGEDGGTSGVTESKHARLLRRALEAGWGWRSDKDDQVHVPLLDWRRWKRVRYWGIEHLMGFRYGSAHDALTITIPVPLPEGTPGSAAACMQAFETLAVPLARKYEVVLGPTRTRRTMWRGERLLIKWVDGHVDFGFRHRDFSAAWAAYPAYGDGCLVYAVSVQWNGEEQLARKLRDRFVAEGFEHVDTLTQVRPSRQ